jgi:hypothetical protein
MKTVRNVALGYKTAESAGEDALVGEVSLVLG